MNLRSTALRPVYRLYEDRILRSLDRSLLPRHVGVIHDGHRRFAKAAGLPDYTASYRVGMDKFVEFLGWCDDLEIPAVTCWLLSKENLERPASELEPYFDVLVDLLGRLPEVAGGHDTRLSVIGSRDLLPARLRTAVDEVEDACGTGRRRVTIALAYGGRQEIVDACRDLVAELAAAGVPSGELAKRIDGDTLAAHLYTADLPDPDLVIRTSGESRLSGFLLWQAAYAEYSFTDVYWPAFRRVDFLRALRDFTRRERRFGR